MKITLNTIENVYKAKKCSIDTMQFKGYRLIKELFVDSSGLGYENEMAQTQSQFKKTLTELLTEHGTLTAKITNAGQFQVYVGLFKKENKSKMQKIANNTYRIDTKEGYKIRLHDTNILEFKKNKIILNSGGYQTHTTKKRISAYLPLKYNLFQKDFNWFVRDIANKKIIPFEDNMILTG